jgi:chemotaxis protein CheZ
MTKVADDFDSQFEVATASSAKTRIPLPIMAESSIESALDNPADQPIYERLGGIVRQLHDSLRELGYDRSLTNVATQVNDAQGRLEYIATLTEQAATKVLNAIDVSIPAQDVLAKDAQEISERWTLLFDGKLSIEELKKLAGDSQLFSKQVVDSADAEKARLLEIMMAQDFQDITGQLIKKIVKITHSLETELAQLLQDNAPESRTSAAAMAQFESTELMSGPSIPANALAQNDVDSLLGDLGFQ